MKVIKRGKEYWILGVQDMDPEGCGPYDDKEVALVDMRGMEKFEQNVDKRKFFTSDPLVKRENDS